MSTNVLHGGTLRLPPLHPHSTKCTHPTTDLIPTLFTLVVSLTCYSRLWTFAFISSVFEAPGTGIKALVKTTQTHYNLWNTEPLPWLLLLSPNCFPTPSTTSVPNRSIVSSKDTQCLGSRQEEEHFLCKYKKRWNRLDHPVTGPEGDLTFPCMCKVRTNITYCCILILIPTTFPSRFTF